MWTNIFYCVIAVCVTVVVIKIIQKI